MATGTHAGSTWNTNNSPITHTVVATPAANDLIVVVHGGSGWASGDTSVITDDQSGTYTQIGSDPLSVGGGTAGALWISIRTALIPSATSTTFTATETGLTGGGLTVLRFSGMTLVGAAAARQSRADNSGTESPPTITFGTAVLTENPVVLAVFGEDNPLALTSPTGFTEAFDAGWATPTSGVQVCWDDAGNTATLYSWTGGATIDHNDGGVELDTSVPADRAANRSVRVTPAVHQAARL